MIKKIVDKQSFLLYNITIKKEKRGLNNGKGIFDYQWY